MRSGAAPGQPGARIHPVSRPGADWWSGAHSWSGGYSWPCIRAWFGARSGLALVPACAAGLGAQPALAHEDIWSRMWMGEPALMRDGGPAWEKPRSWSPASAAAPLSAGAATAPARPLQDRETRRDADMARRPTTTIAGWDIYASVRLDAVNDNGGEPAASLRARPAALLTRDLGSVRLSAHGAVDLPLYASQATPGAGYRFGGAIRYQPANDMWVDIGLEAARLEAARLGLAAGPIAPGPGSGFSGDGRQLACGSARVDLATCERLAGGISAVKQAGDFTFTAQGAAASSRWSSPLMRQVGDDGVLSGALRASRRFSHQFEPYAEIAATRWRTENGAAGRERLVAGALFPEISLFSGKIYAGMDRPAHGAVLPVLGGALSWSPRRSLVFAARAETGAADGLPPDAGLAAPVQRIASESHWRAGRQTLLSLSARWTPVATLKLTLAAAWERARWRPLPPSSFSSSAARDDHTTSATAALAWAFSPEWLARLEVAAIRQTFSPGQPQRRIVTVLSVQRML
ncbi:hypothetical protein ACERNI_17590 [Camelimonas sp. ID_303_24]